MTASTHLPVSRRFSAAAANYNSYSSVQKRVASLLLTYIPSHIHCQRILEVGCGTGHLTRLTHKIFSDTAFDAIDISDAMIQEAHRNFSHHANMNFIVADARNFSSSRSYDLILSSSSLQWAIPLETCFKNLKLLLQPKGFLVCALMIKGTLAELHETRQRIAPWKLPSSHLPSGDEVVKHLTNAGFIILQKEELAFQETYPSSRAFLFSIHNQGVTGGNLSRSETVLNRTELQQLIADYDTHYNTDTVNGGVRATYQVLFFCASKALV